MTPITIWAPNKSSEKFNEYEFTTENFARDLTSDQVLLKGKGPKITGPKMEPLLEPRPSGSQGSRACVFRNYTRGVERLLELELYAPKRREGSCYIPIKGI